MNVRRVGICALFLASACVTRGETVELRASKLPEGADVVEVSFVGGAAPRRARVHVPSAQPLRIAVRVAPGERIDGVKLLDVFGQQRARMRLLPSVSQASGAGVTVLGVDLSYFVDVLPSTER